MKYVLSGLLRCPCGATFEAQSRQFAKQRGGVYVCSAARRKGRTVCASTIHLPINDTDASILDTVERELLDVDVFTEALDVATARLTVDAPSAASLASELARLDRELANLAGAIVAGGSESTTLVAEMRKRELREQEIERRLVKRVPDRNNLRATLVS